MHPLRHFALAAFLLDVALGAGVLLASDGMMEAGAASSQEVPGVAVMYHRAVEGCEAYHEVAEGVWRYGGLTREAACEAAGR